MNSNSNSDNTPPEIINFIKKICSQLLPSNSKEIYEWNIQNKLFFIILDEYNVVT